MPPRLVIRGARWPGDVAVEGGWITAVGEVAPQPGEQVLQVDGDIVTAGGAKAAWFKDPEGNIMAIIESL